MPRFLPALPTPASLLHRAERRFQFQLRHCAGDPGCRRFTLIHRRLRKDGVFLLDRWLCSPGCLRIALARTLAAPVRAGLHAMPRLPRMPFRLLLLQQGALTQQQLGEAVTYSERTGLTLARSLLKLELVSPAAVASALAAENGCAFYGLPPAPVEPGFELPFPLAVEAAAAAVHATPHAIPGRLLIGFVHRIDHELLRAAQTITGLRAEPCFITEAHHARQLALTAQTRAEAAPPTSVPEAAALLTQHALRAAAERLLPARVRDSMWVRLQGSSGHRDHLVRLSADDRSQSERVPTPVKKNRARSRMKTRKCR